jgi:hypothetical protein
MIATLATNKKFFKKKNKMAQRERERERYALHAMAAWQKVNLLSSKTGARLGWLSYCSFLFSFTLFYHNSRPHLTKPLAPPQVKAHWAKG